MDKPIMPILPGGSTPSSFLTEALGKQASFTLDRLARTGETWQGATPSSLAADVGAVRELAEQELGLLSGVGTDRAAGPSPASYSVQKLRARHHEIARLMACGVKDVEIAGALECSTGAVAMLRRSPSFISLLLSYMKIRDDNAADLSSRIAGMAGLGLDRIQDYLSGEDEIPLETLRKLTVDMLDRAGHAPVLKTKNLNVNLTPADIAAIKELHAPSAACFLGQSNGGGPDSSLVPESKSKEGVQSGTGPSVREGGPDGDISEVQPSVSEAGARPGQPVDQV